MSTPEIKEWSKRVLHQLSSLTDLDNDSFTILAGQKYRKYLLPYISHYKLPLTGLAIGYQLQKLNKLIEERKHG